MEHLYLNSNDPSLDGYRSETIVLQFSLSYESHCQVYCSTLQQNLFTIGSTIRTYLVPSHSHCIT